MADILTVFRSNLEANVALPVAAMISLVEIIKVNTISYSPFLLLIIHQIIFIL